MDQRQHKLVKDLARGSLPVDAFVAQFGVDPRLDREFVPRELERAMVERSSDDVSSLMLLVFHFKVSSRWAPILGRLLGEEWPYVHEDIAGLLQDIRDPGSVDCLFAAAEKQLPYLEYDDAHALGVKCIWALHDIGTEAARMRLEALLESNIGVIREAARKRLDDLASRGPDTPEKAYRRARDARVCRD